MGATHLHLERRHETYDGAELIPGITSRFFMHFEGLRLSAVLG
jgi:hypothetical protein